MRRSRAALFLTSIVLMCLVSIPAIPAFAHHGNAAIDSSKLVTVTGTVTEWVWSNPHCFLKMDAKDEKGKVVHWVVEENNPSTLVGFGWGKKTLKPGDEVTVTMHVARNGNPVGRPQKVFLKGKGYLPQADSRDDGTGGQYPQ